VAYKVPFVNYPEHYRRIKTEIDSAFERVLSGGNFILRDDVRQFEQNIASFLGVKYAIGLNSGTDALLISLLAAGVREGDEVITVAHTFLATVGAIVNCRATPVLIDVSKDYNMNADFLEKTVTPRTKAIIPVHLNGRLCDMDTVMAVARRHNLMIIEDAAQALGATYDGRKAGSFGLTACFSFYPAKILGTAGDGGMVTTNDEKLAYLMRSMRDNGRVTGQDEVTGYGFNSRLDNLHAAMLSVKFKYLPQWIERRREIALMYENGLKGVSGLDLPPPPQNNSRYFDAFQNYVIRTKQRDELVSYLKAQGVEVLISWPLAMHHQPALGLTHFKLPETEAISREVLSLPIYPELSDEQVKYVIETVKKFFSGK
jgi:dTDP-4-amino-4,6-dideoxygalactose transaminase